MSGPPVSRRSLDHLAHQVAHVLRFVIQGFCYRHPTTLFVGVHATRVERRLPETPSMLTDTLEREAGQVMASIRFLAIDPRQL